MIRHPSVEDIDKIFSMAEEITGCREPSVADAERAWLRDMKFLVLEKLFRLQVTEDAVNAARGVGLPDNYEKALKRAMKR